MSIQADEVSHFNNSRYIGNVLRDLQSQDRVNYVRKNDRYVYRTKSFKYRTSDYARLFSKLHLNQQVGIFSCFDSSCLDTTNNLLNRIKFVTEASNCLVFLIGTDKAGRQGTTINKLLSAHFPKVNPKKCELPDEWKDIPVYYYLSTTSPYLDEYTTEL